MSQSDFDEGLSGNSRASRFFIERVNHPRQEYNINPFLFLVRLVDLDRTRELDMSLPESKYESNFLAFINLHFLVAKSAY